jgi:integrase
MHLEIVAEKLTVRNFVEPVAMRYRMPVVIMRGNSGIDARYQISQRFRASGKSSLFLFCLGDCDPDGDSIVDTTLRSMRDDFAIEAVDGARVAMSHAQSERHIAQTLFLIREVCAAANFVTPDSITADGLNRIMAEIKAKGKSARTMQARVVAMKAFTKWLADHGKLAHDPLRSVKRPSAKADRRLRRRMLLPAEWPYLRAATLTSGARCGMHPLERAILYAVAIQTGLRDSELRSLTKSDLFLAGEKPYIRCRAENTKNKQAAKQYIETDLTGDLREIVATKTPTANVFSMADEFDVAGMLRGDLAAARRQWLDELRHNPEGRAKLEESDFLAVTNHQGETLDFHSLRHTTGSWLALQVHPNVIKTVMRHSCITLTMDTYGHLLPVQHAEAVIGMARIMDAGKSSLRAAVGAAVAMRQTRQDGASPCEAMRATDASGGDEREPKSLQLADLCEEVHDTASKGESASCRTRTYNPLIKSQLLCQLS